MTCTLLNSSAATMPSIEFASVQISSSFLLPGSLPLGLFLRTGVTQARALLTLAAHCSMISLAAKMPLSSASSSLVSSIMQHAAIAPCGSGCKMAFVSVGGSSPISASSLHQPPLHHFTNLRFIIVPTSASSCYEPPLHHLTNHSFIILPAASSLYQPPI